MSKLFAILFPLLFFKRKRFYIFLVPSAPRELQIHSLVEIKHDLANGLYVVMKWKPPAYTGDSIYAYDFRVQGHTANSLPISLHIFHYHLILEHRDDEWIYSSPIFAITSFVQDVVVEALNDAGVGEAVQIRTKRK